MGAFEFNALDGSGRQRKGVLEGDTPRGVRQQLREKGWVPLSVEEVRSRESAKSKSAFFSKGMSTKDLALVTRQISTLVGSGTPVEEALGAVARQTHKPRIKSIILGVRSKVMEGYPMATAMADFPGAFPSLYQATVAAGEQSGKLDGVLDRLADYTEKRQELTQNVVSALIYPVLLLVVSIGIISLMLTVVVPKIVPVFESAKGQLPLPTVILMATSNFLIDAWLPLLIVGVGSMFGLVWFLRLPGPKYRFHAFLLRVPFAGELVRGMHAARFARTFSILTGSGVPVLEALSISAKVIGNLPMRKAVEDVARKVREGASINRSLEATHLFPPMLVHLIAAGEASGRLEEMLERAANSQERELESTLGTLVGLVGPMMILGMGLVVMFIMAAILMPIFKMNQLIK